MTVVVGFAEAICAPEAVWSLVDAGHKVVAFSRRGRSSALHHSRHVVCHEVCPPELDARAAITDLQALLRNVDAESSANGARRILYPLDDTSLWICNELALEPGWLLAGPQGRHADLALNKHLQTQAAIAAGFRVPRAALARTADDVFAFAAAACFPIILKAAECVPIIDGRKYAGRNWICANGTELEHAVSEWGGRLPLLVQSFVPGNGEGVFGLAAPDGVRAWSAHRRLRMMNPQGSGSSACVSQPVPADVRGNVEALIAQTGWRGLFMIELLRDTSGQLWFVELNGRPWGSLALSRRQGLEYPAWHVSLALDSHSRAGMTATSVAGLICRHVAREIMYVLFVMKGPKSKALSGWPTFWQALRAVLRVHRGDTVYNWRRTDARVFVADCYYTLHSQLFKHRD